MTPERIRSAVAHHRRLIADKPPIGIAAMELAALGYADLLEGKMLLVRADAPQITVHMTAGQSDNSFYLLSGKPAGRYVLIEGEQK